MAFTPVQYLTEIVRIGPNFYNSEDQRLLYNLRTSVQFNTPEAKAIYSDLETWINFKNKEIWELRHHPADWQPEYEFKHFYKMGNEGQFIKIDT